MADSSIGHGLASVHTATITVLLLAKDDPATGRNRQSLVNGSGFYQGPTIKNVERPTLAIPGDCDVVSIAIL